MQVSQERKELAVQVPSQAQNCWFRRSDHSRCESKPGIGVLFGAVFSALVSAYRLVMWEVD